MVIFSYNLLLIVRNSRLSCVKGSLFRFPLQLIINIFRLFFDISKYCKLESNGNIIINLCFILTYIFFFTDLPRYETAYACEGKTLKIECKDGEVIHLIRANYGRFSITICNDHGNTEWSVNCMSNKSLRVLHSRFVHFFMFALQKKYVVYL